jgi:FG-GAP repeat
VMLNSAKLMVAGATEPELVGSSIAVSGAELAVTAPDYAVKGVTVGAVYLFTAGKSGWTNAKETAVLPLPHLPEDAQFASSVSIGASTIAVGAYWANNYDGAVYTYSFKN